MPGFKAVSASVARSNKVASLMNADKLAAELAAMRARLES